jgi:hypothetical protein
MQQKRATACSTVTLLVQSKAKRAAGILAGLFWLDRVSTAALG